MSLPTITHMGYQALLFCADQKTISLVSQILCDLDFSVEPCSEPFETVKKLASRHYDALVVDCTSEQDSALLFKTARNSELNRESLVVAIVEGQAGITRAFRIGANLVLTKPINAEQTKGTLRVARGLLRKGDKGKSAPPESVSAPASPYKDRAVRAEASAGSTASTAPSEGAAKESGTLGVAQPTAQLQVEEKISGPKPDAAEAGLMESLPEPAPAKPMTGISQPSWQSSVPLLPEKTLAAAASAPAASAETSASAATKKDSPAQGEVLPTPAETTRTARFRSVSSEIADADAASGAAPARAKELPRPIVELFESKTEHPAAAPQPAAGKSKPSAKKTSKETDAVAGEPEDFSWQDSVRNQEAYEEQHSKKNFVIAAALVLGLAAGGYFAWPRLQPYVMSLPFVQSLVQRYIAEPAPPAVPSRPSAPAAPSLRQGVPEGSQQGSAPSAAATPAQPSATPASENGAISSSASPQSAPGGVAAPAHQSKSATAGTAVASGPASAPVHLSSSAADSLLVTRVDPVYPPLAQKMHVVGLVVLDATIGKDGSITSVKLLRGEPILARAALDAVRQWKYHPYSVNGQAVEVRTEINVNFKLR